MDPAASSAHQLLLCEWHLAAHGQDKPLLCNLYHEQHTASVALRIHETELGGVTGTQRLPLLSRDGILAANRKLLTSSPLVARIEVMLSSHHLVKLTDPQILWSSRCRSGRA